MLAFYFLPFSIICQLPGVVVVVIVVVVLMVAGYVKMVADCGLKKQTIYLCLTNSFY